MKKIIASAVGLMMVGGVATTASAAVENQFGGYWRNRFIYMDNFKGTDTPSEFVVDTRTRLFYTAKFSDDFKFVNKFEFNTTHGDKIGGDVGADGTGIWRIKNSYADFNLGKPVNVKMGIQAAVIGRGFIFDDDFSGVIATGKFGTVSAPLAWIAVRDENADATLTADENLFGAMPTIKINDGMSVTPYFIYHTISGEETDNWYLGADADLKFGSVSVWGTGIYNGGTVKDADNKGFLVAAGVDAGIARGAVIYASGDDDATDGDNDAFVTAPGAYYAWAEILGDGIFDRKTGNGGTTAITNRFIGNAGVTVKPMDKLTVKGDVWYVQLAEENAAGDDEVGWELDGMVTYNIFDNLSVDAVFAYLISGDVAGEEDIMEGGVRFSLKF
jgi:hypothetical protein